MKCRVRGTPTALLLLGMLACSPADGRGGAPIGSQGGPCTEGGGCDPGLVCVANLCKQPGGGADAAAAGGAGGRAGTGGASGGRTGRKDPGGTGDACASNSDCISDDCAVIHGWCMRTCTSSKPDCSGIHGTTGTSNEFGRDNWCLVTLGSSNECFAGCATTSDCTPYPGTACQAFTETGGLSVHACAPRLN